ncbi:MAG: hypothetical protein OXN97_08870 [Bryobacterales bacterium]|nr:hypothetical protein [Bryobacterales bacterium]
MADDLPAIGESFRHRLALELDFADDLEPHQTVTLNIEGTATEKLSGGEVQVLLPTFAAMDEAGGDKRPSYPVGKALPVHSRWNLPIMDAGAQWKQSVDIELPDKGYYQVIVAVDAETIDDKNPSVIGAYDHERWMLVADDGGLVTYFLDPDELPDGVLPEAGPFRNAARPSQAAADGFGDVGMDADDDEVEFKLSFYSGGYLYYADGAELWVTYYDESDDEAVYEVTRSIGSDGLAVVPCPASDEYAVAAGVVTDTYYWDGTETLGSTVVWDSDCGDTVPISVNSYAYIGWKNLNSAAKNIKDHFVQIRSAVDWYLVHDSSGTVYLPSKDAISLAYDYAKSWWVAAHEYGHAYHHRALGGIHSSVPGNCRRHDIDEASSWECAYAEGLRGLRRQRRDRRSFPLGGPALPRPSARPRGDRGQRRRAVPRPDRLDQRERGQNELFGLLCGARLRVLPRGREAEQGRDGLRVVPREPRGQERTQVRVPGRAARPGQRVGVRERARRLGRRRHPLDVAQERGIGGTMKGLFLGAMLAGIACGEAVEPHMPEAAPFPWACTITVEGVWFEGNGDSRREALYRAMHVAQPAIDAACAGQTGECEVDIHTYCREYP